MRQVGNTLTLTTLPGRDGSFVTATLIDNGRFADQIDIAIVDSQGRVIQSTGGLRTVTDGNFVIGTRPATPGATCDTRHERDDDHEPPR